MSGIVGLIDFPPDLTEQVGMKIKSQLLRFGWNTWDWWVSSDRTIALGRADIGIFNPGAQPAMDQDGHVLAFFSGELLNRDELMMEVVDRGFQSARTDDADLVLKAYLALGSEFMSKLEGSFHLAILDQKAGQLLVANDRFGLRPLYWVQYKGRLAFAPEVKALLSDHDLPRQLNLTALAEFMRFEHLLGEKTFFEEISLLPTASILRYDLKGGALSIEPYWNFPQKFSNGLSNYQEIVEETSRLFQDSVDKRSAGTNRVGLFLSGGFDSRLIGACLAKARSQFPTVTYGISDSADVQIARRISEAIGGTHHYVEFENGGWVKHYAPLHLELTEGHHSWVHSHGISTLAQVRAFMDVNLTGWGGTADWVGADYWDPLVHEAVDDLALECYLFYLYNQEYSWPGLTEAEEHSLYTNEYRHLLKGRAFESFREELRRLNAYPTDLRAEFFQILNHSRRLTQNFVIFNSSHFENRFPGNDYKLFDFIHSVPMPVRGKRRLQKDVIERINPKLALIPEAADGLLFTRRKRYRIPHHIVTRLKQRTNRHIARLFKQYSPYYADYETWIRTDLRDWANEILLDGQLADRGIFNMDFIKSLLKHLEQPFTGRESHTIGKIPPLMTFEMMLREYFD